MPSWSGYLHMHSWWVCFFMSAQYTHGGWVSTACLTWASHPDMWLVGLKTLIKIIVNFLSLLDERLRWGLWMVMVQVPKSSVHCRWVTCFLWLTLWTFTLLCEHLSAPPHLLNFALQCTRSYPVSGAAEWDVVETVFGESVMHLPLLVKFHFLWLCWGCPLQSHAFTQVNPECPIPLTIRLVQVSRVLRFSNWKLRKGALSFISS